MSTRALYTFIGDDGNHNVYKHHDGYPSGAARTLKTAIELFAWKLPRYESDAFAAAFVTAGKVGWIENEAQWIGWWQENNPAGQTRQWQGGGVRLMPQGDPDTVAQYNCSDIEYRYEIKMAVPLPTAIKNKAKRKDNEPVLWVKAIEGSWWSSDDADSSTNGQNVIFEGPFDDFYEWALKADEKVA